MSVSSKRDREQSMSPIDQPSAKQKLFDVEHADETPSWAIREFSLLRGQISKLDSKIDKRYEVLEQKLNEYNEQLITASTNAKQAKELSIENASALANCERDIKQLKDNHEKMAQMVTQQYEHLEKENKEQKEQILAQESYSRRPNLIIRGLTLNSREPCDNSVRKFLVEVLQIPVARNWHFLNCHTLGKGPSPAVIVRFAFPQQRMAVWNKHGLLKGTSYYLSEDYPSDIENRRRFMYPIVARSNHLPAYRGKVFIKFDKLICLGNVYTVDMLHELPTPINPITISQMENDKYVCFGGVSSCFNGMGNFYVRNFDHKEMLLNGVKHEVNNYNSVEQGYQHYKATQSHDIVTAQQIMEERDPAKQKQLGRRIKNFNQKQWDNVKDTVMESLLLAKFKQNRDLAQSLIATKNKIIVECNHNDTYYSSGLSIGKHNFDESKWTGKNVLGKLLCKVRSVIKQ